MSAQAPPCGGAYECERVRQLEAEVASLRTQDRSLAELVALLRADVARLEARLWWLVTAGAAAGAVGGSLGAAIVGGA